MTVISWIGLGHMGSPMSANLVEAGHTVRGFDLDERAMATARDGGVETFSSMAEALQGAEVVFTMLPKGEHSRAVYLGDQGVLALAPKDALLIDSSTIDVETALELHKAAAEKGFAFVDAPVSGGISGAAAGTLTFMIGGDKDTVARAEQVITPMAGRIVHTGGPGMGQSAKIVNNMMLFVNLEACAEGSVLAAKDVGLALSAGEQTGVDLPAAELAAQRFQRLIDEEYGDLDCSLIVKYAAPDGKVQGWNPDEV